MTMNRRHFLRAAGGSLALPWLDAFAVPGRSKPRQRMVCLCAPLGLHPAYLFPEKAGRDYEATPYLEILKDFREDFTIVSGLCHAGMNPGFAHQASASFLTGAQGAGRPGFKNEISVDQLAAEQLSGETRLASLSLSGEGPGLSWTRTGAPVPASTSPFKVFATLFLPDSPEEVKAQARRLADGRSILDDVAAEAKKLGTGLGTDDREKLDEYATSVRDLEKRLAQDELWFKKPKPKVDAAPPKDIAQVADLIGRTKLLFDLTHLALQTDSTRIITIMLGGSTHAPPIAGVTLGHHDLSHHGKEPTKLDQLKGTKEEGASLLDRTTLFLGSNLGDGSSHAVKNLPVLVAGGGFKHGQHLAFDPQSPPPLCNLFVSMLQQLGLPIDRFSTSTGTLTGLK